MFPNRWSLMWKSNEIEFLSRNPTTNALKKVKVNKWHVENFPICFKVRKHGQQKTCNLSCCAFCHPHQTCLGTNQVANRLKTWMVKRATLLFNSFSCNVAKQVVPFLLPVLPKLYLSSAVIDRKKPTRATLSGNQSCRGQTKPIMTCFLLSLGTQNFSLWRGRIMLGIFTLCRLALASARKPYWIEIVFTHKNGDFGAISITERSCTAPISKMEPHISDTFCATLWCNVNRYSHCSGSE